MEFGSSASMGNSRYHRSIESDPIDFQNEDTPHIMDRYILKSEYTNYDSYELAILLTDLLCKEKNIDATILIPTKRNFKNLSLKKLLTDKDMDNLKNGNKIKQLSGRYMKMEAERTINTFDAHGVILVMYANKKSLAIADQCNNAKAIVAVPWVADESKSWQDKWSPVIVDPDKIILNT